MMLQYFLWCLPAISSRACFFFFNSSRFACPNSSHSVGSEQLHVYLAVKKIDFVFAVIHHFVPPIRPYCFQEVISVQMLSFSFLLSFCSLPHDWQFARYGDKVSEPEEQNVRTYTMFCILRLASLCLLLFFHLLPRFPSARDNRAVYFTPASLCVFLKNTLGKKKFCHC